MFYNVYAFNLIQWIICRFLFTINVQVRSFVKFGALSTLNNTTCVHVHAIYVHTIRILEYIRMCARYIYIVEYSNVVHNPWNIDTAIAQRNQSNEHRDTQREFYRVINRRTKHTVIAVARVSGTITWLFCFRRTTLSAINLSNPTLR